MEATVSALQRTRAQRRPLVLFVAVLTIVPLMTALAPAASADEQGPAVEYIVGFHDAVPAGLDAGDRFHDGTVQRIDAPLAFAVVRTQNPATFEVDARNDDRVRYVEWDDPHYGVPLHTPNDAMYGNTGHWGSKKIGSEGAWDRTLGSSDVTVAVIDSGLRRTHEEFAGQSRILQGHDFADDDTDPNDDCGHGTHVTGTIGATINNNKGIAGMAQATILPIRGLSQDVTGIRCTGSASDLASALRYAADQGAHVASNSWGGGGSSALNDAIAYAHGNGVVIVAAAGNDGPCTDCVGEPWASNADKVIIVASTNKFDEQSSFSSQGPEIDIAAPGSDILSAWSGDDSDYRTISGTSMAAPHVSGTIALVLTLRPELTYDQVDQLLKNTAVDLGPDGEDLVYGAGRIDADAATVSDAEIEPPNEPPQADFTVDCDDLTCTFNASASSDDDGVENLTFAWDFGNGDTATGLEVVRTYAEPGFYTANLTVDDGEFTDTATDSFRAGPRPTMFVATDKTAYGSDEPVDVTVTVKRPDTGEPVPDQTVTITTMWAAGGGPLPFFVYGFENTALQFPTVQFLLTTAGVVYHTEEVFTGSDGTATWTVPSELGPAGPHFNAPTPEHRVRVIASAQVWADTISEDTHYEVAV